MRYRLLGGVRMSAVGLGAMPLSIEGRPDEARALATVHAALDAGVTLLDTADSYHLPGQDPGHNELLLARALAAYGGATDDVLVATKGGRGRPADGSWTVTGSPRHLKAAAEASRRRLGVEAIGLYQLHKPDPDVPFEDSVGALRELLDAGTIRLAGLSNVTTDQIHRARAILGDRLVSVQNRYSPEARGSEPELRLCAELGLAFLPWSPLGGISRSSLDGPSGPADGTARFAAFHEVARERRVSPQQVCLAWLSAKSPTVIPIPGASRPETVRDSASGADLVLSGEELARLDGALITPRSRS
ncbi:aryl-alcohol dehydrogenase-like predicted oxidoreductase [Streptomyces griseochromogenes]|uniref:Aldo/keto reductase n=1 Tax=Streptomyces griseochromogenes TaxID=68214 RepID=A0A1B1ASM1_9ACTN|nr:aldo/keto reductase [Streptomyces griseochromogenes]ANP49566.1 aldo/keto reductase [Streptomyces griseochromogenes]MBP2051988.1 aryl-alcohol dehydrogenase-like predicted oxidoreductase [Streptomyces griseochromogenes]